MARSPVLPRSLDDPTGLDAAERRAIADFADRLGKCKAAYLDMLDKIEFDTFVTNATRYEFRTDPANLGDMFEQAGMIVDAVMLEGGARHLWFSIDYVLPAYQKGTGATFANLSAQSAEYKAARVNLQNLFSSAAYQRRIMFLQAREFEEMQGLSADVKKELSRTLAEGLARGKGPDEIADMITDRTDVLESRANTIARTETSQAYKHARREEAEQAEQEFGLRSLMLHISAMSPTTRKTHAMRNGTLHTREEQADWYAEDANAINCKCSEIETLVGPDNKPLAPGIVDKAQSRPVQYAGSEDD